MEKTSHLQDLAQEIYSFLARRFPVCCWSDEFVFFPQAVENMTDWSNWDDFSPDSVDETVSVLRDFSSRINQPGDQELERGAIKTPVSRLMDWVLRTLEEQLTEVRTHAAQPTFILTVASVGIVQALQSGEEEALKARLSNLPPFLEKACRSLAHVPGLYRDLGLEMARDLAQWLRLVGPEALIAPSLKAIDDFSRNLAGISAMENFRLEPDLFGKVVSEHTGSGLDLEEAILELEDEAEVAGKLLTEEARKLGYSGDWESLFKSIPGDPVPAGGKKELLGREIRRLMGHCIREGFIPDEPSGLGNLTVEPLPRALSSVRAADSYNARPGNPFQGGNFYIFEGGSLGEESEAIHPVFRMTVAHEVYPGHHLLDCFRWNNPDPLLRPVEYPLYYEGWACFGEDLMFQAGAFERSHDRLILLRRRFRHALRGRVDLMLHSGKMGIKDAVGDLVLGGFSSSRAFDMARKYALRPAYQMCYTIGRRQFQQLFESYGQKDIPGFVNTVLSSGELLFKDLEKVLQQTMGQGDTEKRRQGD